MKKIISLFSILALFGVVMTPIAEARVIRVPGARNHGQYVRFQENRRAAAHSRIGMPIQSRGHLE